MSVIPEDYLPPRELQPARVYSLKEFEGYHDSLNSTEELLDKQVVAGRGDHPAILFEDRVISYKQLLGATNKFGNALRRLGVEEADRVLLRSANVPTALIANFAVLKLGAVIVPTSPLLSPAEIAHVANNAEAKVVVVAAAMVEGLAKALPNCQTVKRVVVFGGQPEEVKQQGFLAYEELVATEPADLAPVRRTRRAVSVLLYTSGTTGMPKGTAHYVEEALIVPDTFGKYGWRVQPDDVICGPAPISLGAGYSTVATIPFRFGATASLIPRFTPEGLFEIVQKHRVTVLSAAPTGYRKMLELEGVETKYDISSLRILTGGGESLTARTYLDWKARFNQEIYEGFGTTEMMYVFVSGAVTRKVKPGAIGVTVPGYEVQVITEDGQVAKPGDLGKLYARGPTGTLYWRPQEDRALLEKQKSVLRDGWILVGDFVTMDEEGYVTFVAREEDLIKSSGYRIGPEEVEDALLKHRSVADAGVIGIPDPVRGENTKAYVILKPGHPPTEELKQEIIDNSREHIAVYKLPREVEFVEALPRTPAGKLLRRVLRDKAATGVT
ncbi:MAG TPA: AMP-binding protein [Candidatus Dormibacteraeota bacterium]|nr:AMP-binding protein [Candidatus Dormibacteraeota bacterium]